MKRGEGKLEDPIESWRFDQEEKIGLVGLTNPHLTPHPTNPFIRCLNSDLAVVFWGCHYGIFGPKKICYSKLLKMPHFAIVLDVNFLNVKNQCCFLVANIFLDPSQHSVQKNMFLKF